VKEQPIRKNPREVVPTDVTFKKSEKDGIKQPIRKCHVYKRSQLRDTREGVLQKMVGLWSFRWTFLKSIIPANSTGSNTDKLKTLPIKTEEL